MSKILLLMLGLACQAPTDAATLDCAVVAEFPRLVECARAKALLPDEIRGICLGAVTDPFERKLG